MSTTLVKFTIPKSTLQPIISSVKGLVVKDSLMPTVASIEFTAKEKMLKLSCLNHEGYCSDWHACEGIELEGVFYVKLENIKEIIDRAPSFAALEFSFQEDLSLTIEYGNRKYRTYGTLTNCSNNIDFKDATAELSLKSEDLLKAIKSVDFATATDQYRYNLCSVFFEIEENGEAGQLNLVATDGHRMSVANLAIDKKISMDGVIVSMDTIKEMKTILQSHKKSQCELKFNEKLISLRVDNVVFISKLMDTKYPDYKKVIPNPVDASSLFVSAPLFLDELKSLGKPKGSVNMTIEYNKIGLMMKDNDGNESRTSLPCSLNFDHPDPISIWLRYDPEFLVDWLEALDMSKSKEVRFFFIDDAKPAMLRQVDNDALLYVVMPMKKS